METETDGRTSLRVKLNMSKRRVGVVRGKTQHVAKLGQLEAVADSPSEAKAVLASMLEETCSALTSPTVLWDLVEFDKVWIAHAQAGGTWGYTIERRHTALQPHYSRSSGSGGGWTREECLTRMREHWYQCNAQLIVDGIVALCTTWRQWCCPRCGYVGRSFAPYVCKAPMCGHGVTER